MGAIDAALRRACAVQMTAVVCVWIALGAEAQTITQIQGYTGPGGSTIDAGVWQADRTPYFTWTSSGTVTGFSFAVDTPADCVADTVTPAVQLGGLADGAHSFEVRALDGASCGPPLSFDLRVDGTGDTLVPGTLQARTSPGNAPIPFDGWTSDADSLMQWTVAPGAAPSAGVSWSLDGPLDCALDTAASSVQLPTVVEGPHTFSLRTIDAAGNCGIAYGFTYRVDVSPDSVTSLFGYASFQGAAIASGVAQTDIDPYMEWLSTRPGLSPTRYSYAVDAPADCVAEGPAATGCGPTLCAGSVQLQPLGVGTHPFQVRTVDDAGNCGVPASFSIVVAATPVPTLGPWPLASWALAALFAALAVGLSRPSPPSAR